MKIKITYPTITFETKEIEVTEEQAEDIANYGNYEKATFIFDNLDDGERDWIPNGKKGLFDAVESEYASIKQIKS